MNTSILERFTDVYGVVYEILGTKDNSTLSIVKTKEVKVKRKLTKIEHKITYLKSTYADCKHYMQVCSKFKEEGLNPPTNQL